MIQIFSVLSRMLLKSFSLQRLESAWEHLLTCQFHDILAGAAIREVCDDPYHGWEASVHRQSDPQTMRCRRFPLL